MIYLDNSATTRVCAASARAAFDCMTEGFFNPSALYAQALTVSKAMSACRDAILRETDAQGGRVIFTSGGTEADNLAILGLPEASRPGRVLYLACEHPAVKEACKKLAGADAIPVPLDNEGFADLTELKKLLTKDTRLICAMQVSNETGAIQPIEEIARLRDELSPNARLHVDGVQGFLRIPFSLRHSGADSYALSGHKLHAPKGIGALVLKQGARIVARQLGGGQESALRSGTENTPGILALLAAIVAYPKVNGMREVKARLYEELKDLGIVNGPLPLSPASAPHILNMSFPPVRGETMLHALEAEGIVVGTGSACSSHKKTASDTLLSMGIDAKRAECALRFSLCPDNTQDETIKTARALRAAYQTLGKFTRR